MPKRPQNRSLSIVRHAIAARTRTILPRQHAGFSIENGPRILVQPTREALCPCIVRRYGLHSSAGRQPVARQAAGGRRSRNLE